MTHIDISLSNKVIEQSIDTPTFLLIYQDGTHFRTKGDFDLSALGPLLSVQNVQKLLPAILQIISRVQK